MIKNHNKDKEQRIQKERVLLVLLKFNSSVKTILPGKQ